MNKSFLTNLLSVILIGIGFVSPYYSNEIKTMGFFAFSGALTNWIAIHMLFEKVPGFYAIGEALDVAGWLGGYNFQWAWASAYCCAVNL